MLTPYNDGYVAALLSASRALRPPLLLSVSDWAEHYRVLPPGKTSEPGRWDGDRIPYLRGVMAALDDDHPAPLVVFIKSSQVGGTMCALNWIGRTIHQAPRSMLILFPTEKDGRKWVRANLEPMLQLTPELRRIIPPGRKGDAGSTLQEKYYPGGTIYTGSAGVPSDVASISVGSVILDEVDRMPPVLEGEGDPIELAKRRTATFSRRKILEISTPTTETDSRIHADWLTSTQDRYFVPCPHCNTLQALSFERLIWPDGRPKLAVYQCEECENEIAERAKTAMLRAGEWRAAFPDREELVKGFHINGLYTPIGLGDSWAEHALAWDSAQGNPAKIQVFYNTRRGEVVKDERRKVSWEALYARREPYKLRTIPPGILLLTGSADIQHDRIEVHILGHGRDEKCAVVDHQVLEGDPTHPAVWNLLDDYCATELLNSFGVVMRISCYLIDSGYLQHYVTNFTRERRTRNIFASKGSTMQDRIPIARPTKVDVRQSGKVIKYGAEQYQIGASVIKQSLFARLAADEAASPADRLVRFSEDLGREYFKQLAAEVQQPGKGWVKIYDHNEALDLMVLGLAAAYHPAVAIHRMRELDWQRLEQLYQPNAPKPIVAAPVEGKPQPAANTGLRGFMPTMAKVKG
jgi:phage terminase large subunit GpA-like protein